MSTATSQQVGAPFLPRFPRDALVQNGVALLTLLLVAAPLLPILYQSVVDRPLYDPGQQFTLGNFARLASSATFREALTNTLIFAVLSTIIAQVIGLVTAIVVARTDVPGRGFFADALIWPLFVSHLVMALGWTIMYGPSGYVTGLVSMATGIQQPWNLYTIPGLSVVAGVATAPLTFLYCLASANAQDPALEDAARTVGAGPLRVLFSVSLPLLRPALVFSTVQNFVIALETLSIPLLLGGPVGLRFFTTFIYEEGLNATVTDYGLVGAAAVVLLLIVTGLILVQNRLLRNAQRFVTVGGKASRPRVIRLGGLRWPVFLVLLLYFLLAVVAVAGGLLMRAATSFLTPFVPPWEVLTWANFHLIFSYEAYVRSIWNTLIIAVVGGAIGTVLIALIALVAQRSEYALRRPMEFIALFPRAVPGILAGMGAFYVVMLIPAIGWLRNTVVILTVVFIMRYIPTGYAAIAPTLMQIGRDLDRGARSVGADWWTACTSILMGLIKAALLSCFVILFIHFLKEYTAAVFLFTPGSEVMGTTMLTFWVQGDTGPVAALACLQVAITAAMLVLTRRLFGVRIYG